MQHHYLKSVVPCTAGFVHSKVRGAINIFLSGSREERTPLLLDMMDTQSTQSTASTCANDSRGHALEWR